MKLYVTGDSHCGALLAARGGVAPDWPWLDIAIAALGNGFFLSQPFCAVEHDAVRLTRPDYAENLRKLTGSDAIRRGDAAIYGFRMGFHSARLFRDPMWTRFVPAALADVLPGDPVSQAVLDAMIDADLACTMTFLEAVRGLGVRCAVIAAPPPQRGHACLREGVPAATLIHVDCAYRDRTAQRLSALGVPCVLPPSEAFAADGFLDTTFRQGIPEQDPHHANGAYGKLMLSRLLLKLRQLGWV